MGRHKKIEEGASVQQILQMLKDKTISGRFVPLDKRAEIVGYLSLEGWTHSQIAQLFEFSEKNVQRALQEFRRQNQTATSPEFMRERIGYFLCASDNQVAALLRLARSLQTSTKQKIEAEFAAWKIRLDTISKLQSLGFLPIQPQQINADLFHHSAEALGDSPIEMKKLIENIEHEGRQAGVIDDVVREKIEMIKVKIQQIEVSREIINLKQETEKKGESNEG